MSECTTCEQEMYGREYSHKCRAKDLAKIELLKRILDVTTPVERLEAYAYAYECLTRGMPQYIHPAPYVPPVNLGQRDNRRRPGRSIGGRSNIGEGPQM